MDVTNLKLFRSALQQALYVFSHDSEKTTIPLIYIRV